MNSGFDAYSQRGFTLVSAIFLLVVIAGLGAALVTVSTGQQRAMTLDVQSSRVYQAARSGIEWGVHQVVTTNACFASPNAFVPPAATLNGFAVQVTCAVFVANGVTVYELNSTACNFPANGGCPGAVQNMNYVERQISVRL